MGHELGELGVRSPEPLIDRHGTCVQNRQLYGGLMVGLRTLISASLIL